MVKKIDNKEPFYNSGRITWEYRTGFSLTAKDHE